MGGKERANLHPEQELKWECTCSKFCREGRLDEDVGLDANAPHVSFTSIPDSSAPHIPQLASASAATAIAPSSCEACSSKAIGGSMHQNPPLPSVVVDQNGEDVPDLHPCPAAVADPDPLTNWGGCTGPRKGEEASIHTSLSLAEEGFMGIPDFDSDDDDAPKNNTGGSPPPPPCSEIISSILLRPQAKAMKYVD
ncbi:hypothetical protein ACLOJK_012880 [Asimina triloba]